MAGGAMNALSAWSNKSTTGSNGVRIFRQFNAQLTSADEDMVTSATKKHPLAILALTLDPIGQM